MTNPVYKVIWSLLFLISGVIANPRIVAPSTHAELWSEYRLKCNATLLPGENYKWILNETFIQGEGQSSLLLQRIELSDTGNYQCGVTEGRNTSLSEIFTVVVYYLSDVVLRIQPSSKVEVNTQVQMACEADSNLPLQYTFFRDESIVRHTSNSSTYNFTVADRSQSGMYRCSVNISDALKSNSSAQELELSVSLGKPTLSFEDDTVYPLATVTVTCHANTSLPWDIDYTIYDDDMSVVASGTSNKFMLNRPKSGMYRCKTQISSLTETSDPVKLTVGMNVSVPDVVVDEHFNKGLTCLVEPHKKTQLFYKWKVKGTVMQTQTGRSLDFRPATRADNGVYECEVKTNNGYILTAQGRLTVQWLDQPSLTANTVHPKERSPVKLSCETNSNPSAVMKILKNSNLIKESATLDFDRILRTDSGTYQCIATNALDSKTSNSLNINVLYVDKPIIVINEGERNPQELSKLTLQCRMSNSNTVSREIDYKWYKGGEHFSSKQFHVYESIKRGDTGTYKCEVSVDGMTAKSDGLTINVQYGPGTLTFEPPDANPRIKVRSSFTVVCTSNDLGLPEANLSWVLPTNTTGVKLTEDGKSVRMLFQSVSKHHKNSYICRSENQFKKVEKILTIVPIDVPTAPKNFSVVSSTESSIDLVWKAPDDNGGSITEYFLEYTGSSLESVTISFPPTESYKLAKLNPGTLYQLKLRAKNEVDKGLWSATISVTTTETVPSKPLNLFVYNDEAETLRVQWSEPNPTNGEIKGYYLCHQQTSLSAREDYLKNMCGDVGLLYSKNLTSLANYAKYIISVSARNGAGYGPYERATNTTMEAKPYPVENIAKLTELAVHSMVLKWDPPKLMNGIFKSYSVSFRESISSNSGFEACVSIINSTCKISELKPYTLYNVVVTTQNNKFSSKSEFTLQTLPGAPPPFTGQLPQVTEDDINDGSFTLAPVKFEEINGPISYYLVVVVQLQAITKLPSKPPQDYTINELLLNIDDMYLAANLTNMDTSFTIGSGGATSSRKRRSTGGVSNPKLIEEQYYTLFVRAVVASGEYQSTGYYPPLFIPATGLAIGAILGIVFAFLVVLIIVLIFVWYFRFRKRDRSPGRFNFSERKKKSFLSPVGVDHFAPVTVKDFKGHVNRLKANGNYGFAQEYGMINRDLSYSFSHSRLQENNVKNRYHNIPSYDNTRVKLEIIDNDSTSDYINANYVEGFDDKQEYIATQGPLPETVFDFWRMVWETECATIVMLTRLEERGRVKCGQYWPDSSSLLLKDIVLTATEVYEFPDHIVRTFHVTRTGQAIERIIKQFHYMTWPDFGVPSDPSSLLSFIRKVNNWKSSNSNRRAIVHCSAGVGRTGTYITIDTQIKQLKQRGEISVFANVSHLREQRCLLVQTEDQYVFIHLALLDHMESGETEIDANDLRDYVKMLSTVLTSSGITGFMEEFIRLVNMEEKEQFGEANRIVNHPKNRYKNVCPYDATRVKLSTRTGVDGSDYINANYIDSYMCKDFFIATQAPLESTVGDFWRMVWEQMCSTVVMLVKEKDSLQLQLRIQPYWPQKNSMKIEHFIIELNQETTYGDYIIRDLKITNTETSSSRDVKHFQYTTWPEGSFPESGFGIIEMIGRVQKWNTVCAHKCITVHCSAGVARTGVFIALTNLIERVKTEALVDVYQTIKRMRQKRPAMVQTKEQYEFCYRVLQEYLDSFDLYANFR